MVPMSSGRFLAFSEACERNKDPILRVLQAVFADRHRVLEVGAGTGQHAVHLARHLQHLRWQPTDRPEWLPDLAARIADEGPENLEAPVTLDVRDDPWPSGPVDAVFSANTLHIMSWLEVESFFAGVGRVLAPEGVLALYGPFRYGGAFTSPSNAEFDLSLRRRDPACGIRDFEAVDALAGAQGLRLAADHPMPANNQLLVWRRT
jgi:cyclopropane fatty-acyl-phospholipid synthase-like methyltransferase